MIRENTAASEKREFVTVAKMAELLSVCDRTIYDLIGKKRIPYYRVGAHFRLDPKEVKLALRRQGEKKQG